MTYLNVFIQRYFMHNLIKLKDAANFPHFRCCKANVCHLWLINDWNYLPIMKIVIKGISLHRLSRSLWKQACNVFRGSEGSFVKSEKWTLIMSSGLFRGLKPQLFDGKPAVPNSGYGVWKMRPVNRQINHNEKKQLCCIMGIDPAFLKLDSY